MVRSCLLVLGAAALMAQASAPTVPSCQIAGAPNPRFEAELKEAVRGLASADRKAFFKALRTKQRDLQHRILEVDWVCGRPSP